MPADEQIRFVQADLRLGHFVVMVRIPADMGHQYGKAFTAERLKPGVYRPHIRPVDISENSPKGLEPGNLTCTFDATDITGMPYLVHTGQKIFKFRVESAVRVGYDSYFFHGFCIV